MKGGTEEEKGDTDPKSCNGEVRLPENRRHRLRKEADYNYAFFAVFCALRVHCLPTYLKYLYRLYCYYCCF